MSIERFVAFFLGPIITAGSAWLAGAAAKYGLHLDATEITTFATAGAVAAAGFVLKWLHGRSPEMLRLEQEAKSELAKLPPGLRSDLESFIKAEIAKGQEEIVKLVGGKKPTPPLGANVSARPVPTDSQAAVVPPGP